MRRVAVLTVLGLWVGAVPALATEATYSVFMTGDQEVPGPGDSDGEASGTITLNDVTGLISWSLTYSDIAAPSAMHIHGPGGSAGSPAGVFIGLGVATSGGAGTLIDDLVWGTLGDITDILSDPTDFYLNIHNGGFPAGAVRGQLPEPGALAMLALGGLMVVRRRR